MRKSLTLTRLNGIECCNSVWLHSLLSVSLLSFLRAGVGGTWVCFFLGEVWSP